MRCLIRHDSFRVHRCLHARAWASYVHALPEKEGNTMGSEPPRKEADESGEKAARELFAALYSDLRQLAHRQLRRNQGLPVSPTTLLHEAYLDLSGRDVRFHDRERFMGYAARAMRSLIIDLIRERRALKRGAGFHLTELRTELPAGAPDEHELTRLSEAIDELAAKDARLAQIVDLRYFCGYTLEEIAAMQGRSLRTIHREWEKARTILFAELQPPS